MGLGENIRKLSFSLPLSAVLIAAGGAEPATAQGSGAGYYVVPALAGTVLGAAAGGGVGILLVRDEPGALFAAAVVGAVAGNGAWVGHEAGSARVGLLSTLGGVAVGLALSGIMQAMGDRVSNGAPLVVIPIGHIIGSIGIAEWIDTDLHTPGEPD